MKEIRYDEVQEGDIVLFHGMRERVVKVRKIPSGDCLGAQHVDLQFEPADEATERLFGKFYSHGRYGGYGFLKIALLKREA